ncbi:MAG: hypothetical protein WKG07_26315 [Hymenobacter sp.]
MTMGWTSSTAGRPMATTSTYSSTSRDIAGMNDIYRVPVGGGTPTPVSADRYANEFFAAPSPDGQALAFAARGIASNQWWRHGHSHLDESEIWLRRAGKTGPVYTGLTQGVARRCGRCGGRGPKPVFYLRPGRAGEHLDRGRERRRGAAGHAV